jgi:hypothetical protein
VPSGSAQQPLPPPGAGADEIRQGADEILSRPEFREPTRSLYQRALDWIGERLGDVLGALVSGGAGAVLAWVLLVAAVLAIAYLVFRAVQRDRRQEPASAGAAVDVERDDRRPPEAWDADAARFEAEGRWREAVRCRYRSLVARLARAGVVEEVPGRTAGEYRTLVASARPPVAEPFAGATSLFERAWYGHEDTGADDSSSFRALADRVTAGAGG